MVTRHDINAELDAAYATLPAIECRGQCSHSCVQIAMTEAERQRITERHGVTIRDGYVAAITRGPQPCVALTILKRCGVYDDRPAICRLWGLVPSMRCDAGCVPEGGFLTEEQGYSFLARVFDAVGERERAASLRAMFATPELARHTERLISAGNTNLMMRGRR